MNTALLLWAIAQLEHGPSPGTHGQYCMKPDAIADVNAATDGRFTAREIDENPDCAYDCAAVYLALLTARLAGQLGAAPSVMELAAAWRGGANGWREHVADYGRRAANLYEDAVRRGDK